MYVSGGSLVVQQLRIHLPVQGTWVRSLVQEDSTCCGAAKARVPQLLSLHAATTVYEREVRPRSELGRDVSS